MEPLLRDNQKGFRRGRSTTSHILALRRILEGARDKNISAVMLFIDFRNYTPVNLPIFTFFLCKIFYRRIIFNGGIKFNAAEKRC